MEMKNINIEMTKEQPIVLFEFLGSFNETDDLDRFEDQSLQRVLWDIECTLEKELSEPFRADCKVIVRKAREKG